MAAGPEPGWYPDPLGSDQQRWWDGVRWTATLRAAPPDPAAAEVTTTLPPVRGPAPTAEEQAWPAPVTEDAWAAPPLEMADDEEPAGRRLGWVWAGATAAVLAVALGVGVGVALRGPATDGDADDDPVASDPSLETEEAIERPAPIDEPLDVTATEPLDTETEIVEEPAEEATEGTELEPPPPASETTETEPEAEPETETSTEASTEAASGSGTSSGGSTPSPGASATTSPPSSTELTGAVGSYILALDTGDFRWAHDHLTPELQQRPGWTLGEFTAFWDGYLAAAEIVSFDEVDDTTGTVRATVDYALQSGDLARESLRMTFVRGAEDRVLMDDYEVLRSVWNP
jgi:hypothetical protein